MSRVGNQVITLPANVTVETSNGTTVVKGPKGELKNNFNNKLDIVIEGNTVTVTRPNDSKEMKTIHGTTRALLNNMVVGVTEGFKKELNIIGVGYRFTLKGKVLNVAAGFSHPVDLEIPEGLTVECPKNTIAIISGIDKQLVGEFSANIRKVRPPEPYKGKGIRYATEHVRRKEGKTSK